MKMKYSVSHDLAAEETPEAKARWFQSLTLEERMDLLVEYTNLILSINPEVAKHRHDRSRDEGFQVLELP